MLQKETVVSEMINIVKELQSNPLFDNHILAGGTALALQLGHRTSTDVDLFTQKAHNPLLITKYFENNYNNPVIDFVSEEFCRIFVNKIKVELVFDNEKILENPKKIENINLFGINEIAAMKLRAIIGRTEARDFIDIAYLLKEMTLEKMFEFYKKKYGSISPLNMKRTLLTKCNSIKNEEWLIDIKMLKNDIIPRDIPKIIENNIEIYNKNIGVGNL